MTNGVVGRKCGMTQIFTPEGLAVPVTVIHVATNRVVQIKQEATDDAMMVESIGGKVKMVMGDYKNIKVTTPEDILLACQLYKGKI